MIDADREVVEALLEVFACLDIACADYPEGITELHRKVGARMGYGVMLPGEVENLG